MWDYLNRMLACGFANSTTTVRLRSEFGARVHADVSTTSTTYYPNKLRMLTAFSFNPHSTPRPFSRSTIPLSMTLVDRANRQRSLTATARKRRPDRIAANAGVATTTYAYDANGNLIKPAAGATCGTISTACSPRASTTPRRRTRTIHPTPCRPARRPRRTIRTDTYSFTSTKSGANTYATSTNYVFNGDTLLATIDQALYGVRPARPSRATSIPIIWAAPTPSPTKAAIWWNSRITIRTALRASPPQRTRQTRSGNTSTNSVMRRRD